MLEKHYQSTLRQLLNTIPCNVEIPAEWAEHFFHEVGPEKTKWDERRRFVRHRYRTKCILETGPSLPAIARSVGYFAVYTRDLSRGGISLLHIEQLFPGERGYLWLPTQRMPVVVRHCRRLNSRCYLIGAESVCAESRAVQQEQRRMRVMRRLRGYR